MSFSWPCSPVTGLLRGQNLVKSTQKTPTTPPEAGKLRETRKCGVFWFLMSGAMNFSFDRLFARSRRAPPAPQPNSIPCERAFTHLPATEGTTGHVAVGGGKDGTAERPEAEGSVQVAAALPHVQIGQCFVEEDRPRLLFLNWDCPRGTALGQGHVTLGGAEGRRSRALLERCLRSFEVEVFVGNCSQQKPQNNKIPCAREPCVRKSLLLCK